MLLKSENFARIFGQSLSGPQLSPMNRMGLSTIHTKEDFIWHLEPGYHSGDETGIYAHPGSPDSGRIFQSF